MLKVMSRVGVTLAVSVLGLDAMADVGDSPLVTQRQGDVVYVCQNKQTPCDMRCNLSTTYRGPNRDVGSTPPMNYGVLFLKAYRAEFHFVQSAASGRWWLVLLEAQTSGSSPMGGPTHFALAHDDDCQLTLLPGTWKLERFPQ